VTQFKFSEERPIALKTQPVPSARLMPALLQGAFVSDPGVDPLPQRILLVEKPAACWSRNRVGSWC